MNKLDIVNKIRDFELEEGELFFFRSKKYN